MGRRPSRRTRGLIDDEPILRPHQRRRARPPSPASRGDRSPRIARPADADRDGVLRRTGSGRPGGGAPDDPTCLGHGLSWTYPRAGPPTPPPFEPCPPPSPRPPAPAWERPWAALRAGGRAAERPTPPVPTPERGNENP